MDGLEVDLSKTKYVHNQDLKQISSTIQTLLVGSFGEDILELSEAASVAHVFPDMANNYFLSVGKLCNEGYSVTVKIDGVTIINNQGKARQGHL
jgi:hypothetical protein